MSNSVAAVHSLVISIAVTIPQIQENLYICCAHLRRSRMYEIACTEEQCFLDGCQAARYKDHIESYSKYTTTGGDGINKYAENRPNLSISENLRGMPRIP